MTQITDRQDQINFLLAGKAKFTLHNTRTGNHFSYTSSKSKFKRSWYFYHKGLARGNDHFILSVVHTEDQVNLYRNPSHLQASKVLYWYLDLLFNNKPIPPFVHLLHLGYCGKCGRELTDPESIKRGIGPVCVSRK